MNTLTSIHTPDSTWEAFFADVSSEEWLTAKALLEIDTHRTVQRDAARWIAPSEVNGHRDQAGEWVWELELDWEGWVADVDTRGRGWSSTESRLFQVVASLVTGRRFNVVGVLDQMGSWEARVWRVLTEWGTGGDNRQRRGRCTATPVTPGRD